MGQFARVLDFYANVSKSIVCGQKIDPNVYDSDLVQDLKDLAARIYTGFSTPLEPQAIIIQKGWGEKEIGFMGNSSVHPISKQLVESTRKIDAHETDFTVYGHHVDTRYDVDLKGAYSKRGTQPHVLTAKGDYVSLSQVTDDLSWRMHQSDAYKLPPIIIQGKEQWGVLFADEEFNYGQLGICFTNTEEETAQILSAYKEAYPSSRKVVKPISDYKIAAPKNIFATTDHVKMGHNQVAQADYKGETRVAHTLVGSYQIPEEQQYSYGGNAWVKMVNIMEIALDSGLEDPTGQMNLVTNDGGLGAFLMNEEGDTYINIFTDKKYFPTSAHVMNPILSGPAVELAELYKSASNFDSVVVATYKKVDDVCTHDKRFKADDDLKVFDAAIQISIPLNIFYDLYHRIQGENPDTERREICEHIARVHTVSVCDIQQTKLFRKAQYDSVPLTTDTEHFLEAEGRPGKSRAQVPEWVKNGPNATTFRMLMDAASAEPSVEGVQLANKAVMRSPKIAVPSMLLGNKGKTYAVQELKKELEKYNINARLGAGYWERFNQKANTGLDFEFHGAASLHRKHIRDLLNENDFLYVPQDCAIDNSPRTELEFLLLISSAMVQRQVFRKDAPFIIMEKGPFADKIIHIFKSLKNMGLIGQKFEHLVKLTDGPSQSAKEIDAIMCLIPPAKRQPMVLPNIKAIPMPENFTAVMYCSASNKNAHWVPENEEIACTLAILGADLKVGGGKEGMMKAAADGYMKGLAQLVAQGIEPKGKLHLIQCDDTVTLEGQYEIPDQYAHLEKHIEKRCYNTIEERRYDLQKSHLPIGSAGGIGTFEELICELIAAYNGEKDLRTYTFQLFSQTGVMPDGQKRGVYDFIDDLMRPLLRHGMININRTKEEMVQLIHDEKAKFDKEPVKSVLPVLQQTAQVIDFPVLKHA
jgi:predicted Rossmann-fold nucleotide-binding protein